MKNTKPPREFFAHAEEYYYTLSEVQPDHDKYCDTNCDHYVEKSALTDLKGKYDKAILALKVYAMTNETFPEYGDVARQTLRQLGEV